MENKKLLEEIRSYWNNRADGYSRVNQEELHSEQKEKWKEVLLEQAPKKEKDQVQILDIGTGTWIFCDPFSGRGISGNGGRLYGADAAGSEIQCGGSGGSD